MTASLDENSSQPEPSQGAHPEVVVRRAQPEDAERIDRCIEPFVQQGRLLPRTRLELENLIPTCFVAEAEGRIVGCAALEVYSPKLAEIRSLVVEPSYQGQGIGRRLVQRCVELAKEANVLEVMTITSAEEFFRSCGFDFTLPGEKKALFVQTREMPIPAVEPAPDCATKQADIASR